MSDDPSLIDRLLRPLTENEVTTETPGNYPEIEPHTYAAPADEVFEAVREIAEARENWDIVESDADAHRLAIEATTPMMGFVDDVTVRLDEEEGDTVVHVRSVSRVGEGDLGKNASRVRTFFERLDAKVT